MRRVRKNLINKQPQPKSSIPIDEALDAREANLLGENGLVHSQDSYLANASRGDLIFPLDQLSTDQKELLEQKLGPLDQHTIGHGRELALSEHVKNGVSIAELSDLDSLVDLGIAITSETAYRDIRYDRERAREFVAMYLRENNTHKIFIHKQDGELQGALFGYVTDYIFSYNLMASEELFYIYPQFRNSRIAVKLIRAFETWAKTKSVIEICFSVSTLDQADRIGKFYERMNYVKVGGVYKKSNFS